MDHFVNEKDFKILEANKYTFFVLKKILKNECRLLLTDHEKLIICYTGQPYPVWVWTPDDALIEDMERAYHYVTQYCSINDGYRYNLKYDLAEYFISKAAKMGKKLKIILNMLAYECPNPIVPAISVEGEIYQCKMKDIEKVVEFMELFHKDVGFDSKNREEYYKDAENIIKSEHMYLWKDTEGNAVASCNFSINDNMASIDLVFTHPNYRRKHYAENLVYYVTKIAKDLGYIPCLYTNADYVASNNCYKKIGYISRGELCTIGQ